MGSKYIEVNGIRLHYVEEGSGDLVVLLHGFPEFWYGWRRQIPVLAQYYRVVAPDMRGYNMSDKPQGISQYKMDLLVQDIAELIEQLGSGRAILAGHDWGAAIAWSLAATRPELISRLAILNVPHPLEMRRALLGFNLRQWARSYYMFLFQLPWLPEWFIGRDPARTFRNVFKSFSPRGIVPSEDEIQEYVKAYRQPGALTGAINYYRAAMRYPHALDASAVLPMPVLMIWGEQDKALGKELTYQTKQYCNDFEIVYDSTSGHFITADNPELVNAKLLEFFAGTDRKVV
ncbi:MAG: alpha/beta hydrolase [Bacteroidetes bacterium]|nr:alpha/beta hydrolase [Bacteroidota bacterium]